MKFAQEIARILLKEGAVFLRPEEPFTWTSGIVSPVYCDNRLLISTVESRRVVVEAFCASIPNDTEVIAGTATAGIPWSAWIAMELSLPLIYVRSNAKEHGRKNAIEGKAAEGSKVVLIEDLISTGKSSLAAVQYLRSAELEVRSLQSIFTYDFPEARRRFEAFDLTVSSLSTFEVLAQVAYDEKRLNEQALKEVLDWRRGVKFHESL